MNTSTDDPRIAGDILVGIDGSASSIEALALAKTFADAVHRPVRVITAWEWPYLYDAAVVAPWDPEQNARSVAEDVVAQVYGDAPKPPIETVWGPAAGVLTEASRDAFLLVVGSRGHGGFAGLLLGSVSSACAEHAHCPVLVVHPRSVARANRPQA